MTTTTDAVEALAFALAPGCTNISDEGAKALLARLAKAGFTISRAEPVTDEKLREAVSRLDEGVKYYGYPYSNYSIADWETVKSSIIRAEPSAETDGIRHSAVADYLKDDKGLRPPMTDAELEREAFQLAVDIWECGAERDRKNDTDKCKKWIVELVKKYRG